MTQTSIICSDQYKNLCSYDNLHLAFKRARKGKTTVDYVLDFESNLEQNIFKLQSELLFHIYRPKHLETFILRDPKTRKISKSAFRDRVVHHALCNIIEPYFERIFINDSYANRKSKGTLKAIQRYDYFARKISQNYSHNAYVLKADIKQYFETVNHPVLVKILRKKIVDPRIMWLITVILANYNTTEMGIGMPLGNLTSQFFANVFLNELDQYVKHTLKAEYYIRYVDDFVILDHSRKQLEEHKTKIEHFLNEKLKLQLHPDKSRIISLSHGVEFLGLKLFPHHKTLKKKNVRKFERKLKELSLDYDTGKETYDAIYDFLEGWVAYTKCANTYKLRQRILTKVEPKFQSEVATKEYNRYLKKQKLKNSQNKR